MCFGARSYQPIALLTASCLFFAGSLQQLVFKAFSLELLTSNMHKESLAEKAIIAPPIRNDLGQCSCQRKQLTFIKRDGWC